MAAYYDHELEHIFGQARIFFQDCEDHSESFLLELGRRAIEDRIDEIEQHGFELTDDDSIVYKDSMGRDCPYYTVESVSEAADTIKTLYSQPLDFDINVGV